MFQPTASEDQIIPDIPPRETRAVRASLWHGFSPGLAPVALQSYHCVSRPLSKPPEFLVSKYSPPEQSCEIYITHFNNKIISDKLCTWSSIKDTSGEIHNVRVLGYFLEYKYAGSW